MDIDRAFGAYDEQEVQRALIFLATHFGNSGRNPKPVVLHSLQVALLLAKNNAPQDSVIAGMLHDVLEDTDASEGDVEKQFGKKISDIVVSLSFDKPINDYDKKLIAATDSFKRSIAIGADAVIVRVCDLVDNSLFYDRADTPELRAYLHAKYTLFMDLAKPLLIDSPFWDLLQQTYGTRVKSLSAQSVVDPR